MDVEAVSDAGGGTLMAVTFAVLAFVNCAHRWVSVDGDGFRRWVRLSGYVGVGSVVFVGVGRHHGGRSKDVSEIARDAVS